MANTNNSKAIAKKAVQDNFSLGKFKDKKGLSTTSVKFKTQEWIPLSKAFQ